MADPAAAPDGSEAAEDDDECEGVAYMFDAAAATERRSLALDHGAVYYYCLADDDAAATHHISGHSAWPAALTLARRIAERWTPVASVLELGCGCGIVGLTCASLGCPRVAFSDRDGGALDLARRGVAANGFGGCTFDRRAWGLPSEERFELVVGSDLIYDPGVVAPLITTAAASLAPGGRFVLAQSFALGDASSKALADACAEHKLALEVVEEAGEARVWEMVSICGL